MTAPTQLLAGCQPRGADPASGGVHRGRAQELDALAVGSRVPRPLVRHCSQVRDARFVAADTGFAPWSVARSDDTKRSLLTIIRHLLAQVPYEDLPREKSKPPKRQKGGGDVEPDSSFKI